MTANSPLKDRNANAEKEREITCLSIFRKKKEKKKSPAAGPCPWRLKKDMRKDRLDFASDLLARKHFKKKRHTFLSSPQRRKKTGSNPLHDHREKKSGAQLGHDLSENQIKRKKKGRRRAAGAKRKTTICGGNEGGIAEQIFEEKKIEAEKKKDKAFHYGQRRTAPEAIPIDHAHFRPRPRQKRKKETIRRLFLRYKERKREKRYVSALNRQGKKGGEKRGERHVFLSRKEGWWPRLPSPRRNNKRPPRTIARFVSVRKKRGES